MSLTRVSFSLINGAPVNVKDFGATGDGITDDRAAIQAAFNSGAKRVYFPSGTYYLGSTATPINFIDLTNFGAGSAIITDKSVKLTCQTTANVIPKIFYMFGNSNFSCGPIQFQDLGYDPTVTWKGAAGFYIGNNTTGAGNWGDLTFEAIYSRNMVASVIVAGGDATHRVRGIHIGQLFSDDCYYGFNAENQGDGVKIDNLIAYQNYRPYYVYGVTSHQVKVFNRNNRSASAAINISRSVGGLDTTNIWVDYTARDMSATITHVLINHIDLLGGTIADIHVNTDIRSSVSYSPIRFVNYTGPGGSETTAPSLNNVRDIFISGSCDSYADAINVTASYASKLQRITFDQGYYLLCGNSVYAAFQFDQQFRGLTPSWFASTVAPSIGNGTLTYDIDINNGMATINLKMVAGTTTTFGTGDWSFANLAFAATTDAVGSVLARVGGTYYSGSCIILSGNNYVQAFGYNNPNTYYSNFPGAWAAGDKLNLSISYPIS